ncbi:hypothetical protein BH10BAC2_BH10BAC2_11010 [soil metagenome]
MLFHLMVCSDNTYLLLYLRKKTNTSILTFTGFVKRNVGVTISSTSVHADCMVVLRCLHNLLPNKNSI